jgi:hypothetical protein
MLELSQTLSGADREPSARAHPSGFCCLVYQYMVLDTNRIERRKARRWGTREAIGGLTDSAEILVPTGPRCFLLLDEMRSLPRDGAGSPKACSEKLLV